MSGLRQTVLELIRTAGNYSGCHQLPERSFFYKGKQFPVCARCTGVSVGQFAAVIVGLFMDIPVRAAFMLLAVMGLDWGIQELEIRSSTNSRRFITGIAGGFGLFSLYVYLFKMVKRRFCKK